MGEEIKPEKRRPSTLLPENLRFIPITMKVDRVMAAAAFFFIACSLLAGTCCSAAPAGGRGKGGNLHAAFYQYLCPQAEQIATDMTKEALGQDPTLAASLMRLFFHDCFVKGCDASVLLDSTPTGEATEKTSPINGKTLRGFEVIDAIKTRLETECPGIVSCADILAYATRDATVFSGLPFYKIPAGRRDGLSSLASDVRGNLPTPIMTVDEMTEIFTRKGMTSDEMVALTGAHSIGKLQCSFFDYRIYNFSGTEQRDPKLQEAYAHYLSAICPQQEPVPMELVEEGRGRTVYFDPSSPFKLDNAFYLRMLEGRTMLRSDQDMADDPSTMEAVKRMAESSRTWIKSFSRAMVRLSRVEVLTGSAGEVRKNCRAVN